MRRLARPTREAASRLAKAEEALEAVSGDVEARCALVSEIEALDEGIEEAAWARRAALEKGREDLFVEVALRGIDERCAEKEACRAIAAAKLVALRAIEPDASLEEREALALANRELLRARAKRAEAELEAAAERLLLREWVRAVVESWFEVVPG